MEHACSMSTFVHQYNVFALMLHMNLCFIYLLTTYSVTCSGFVSI